MGETFYMHYRSQIASYDIIIVIYSIKGDFFFCVATGLRRDGPSVAELCRREGRGAEAVLVAWCWPVTSAALGSSAILSHY